MATVLSPEGNRPQVINARRTDSIDAPHIMRLVSVSTTYLFGRVNIVNLIEKAVLAVTLVNDKEEIMGHAAFFDYPNLESVDQANWLEWMSSYYNTSKLTPLNTLFMHYFVAKKDYSLGCAKEIIRTVFNAEPNLHYIFLLVPTGVFPDASVAEVFKPLDRKEESGGPPECAVFVCHRHQHVPVLHIRRAEVMDNDDLTPIFNRQSDVLSKTYGDYFLAELIEAQNEGMACLVAEVEGLAHGFMNISRDVNYELLNECFELGPFHGLYKPHPDDELFPPEPIQSPPGAQDQDARSEASDTKPSHSGSNASSRAPTPVDGEVKTQRKLSDAQLGESMTSASSVGSAAEVLDQELAAAAAEEKAGTSSEASGGRRTPKAQASISQRFVPKYKGGPNAFCIQLFCIDERYEMRSSDFLGKAFQMFSDLDFCIISVPHLVPEFPLLQEFVRVTPRCPSTLQQELYVFHRSGLLKNFIVRPAETRDTEAVGKLVSTLRNQETLMKDLMQFHRARRDEMVSMEDGREIQAFVASCSEQVVGIAIIRREENIEYIRSHYNIEDFIYYNHHRREDHGHLHHFALNPIFKHLTKHFLKEVLRLGHKTCLYYPLYPPYAPKEVVEKHTLVTCLNEMVPVRSRRQIVYNKEKLGINAPSDRVLKTMNPHALIHINRKLTLEPKVTINARIVVVGASDTGVAFLETLVYCPHMRFNNITLISPHGLPGEMAPDELRDQVLASRGCYTQDEYAKAALRTWVNVVYGKVTAIDRKRKKVVVNETSLVPYDHLILCMGRQYQAPAPTEADITLPDMTNAYVPNSPKRLLTGPPPKNLFLINDPYEAAVMLYKVESTHLKTNKKVIVYGNSVDVFTCTQALLTLGIDGHKITIVQPPIEEVTCLNNPELEAVVEGCLKAAGVTVYKGMYLAQWNGGQSPVTEIQSASFTSDAKPLQLPCDAFFSFYNSCVDFQAFKAIDDACLVYDFRLVIDTAFHTNDVAIRGAGPLTKFKRIYYADPWSHWNFNSKEVGIALASEMLRLFDPTLPSQPEPEGEPLMLIPIYQSPKITLGTVPGGFHYMHVQKPGLPTPLETQMAMADYGKVLQTGKAGGDPEYFRLHLNQYSSIETITCLSKKGFPTSNLICLFGIHERFLNNLASRFDENLIKDFYSFFDEPWAMAVYHDRFADFRDEIRELLITNPAVNMESLEEKVRAVVDEEVPITAEQRKQLLTHFTFSGTKKAVETRLLSFISYNYYHIPMYAKPGMV